MQFKRFVFSSLFLAATATVFAADDSKPVALSEIPSAVQRTINAQIGDGKLGEIDRSNENGEPTFDVSFTTKAGDERGFSVADDGTVLSTEAALAETPAAVQKTVQAHASGWELEGIDKNVDDAEISFDVEVTKDGREKSFTVANDGDLLSEELAQAETPAAVQAAIRTRMADGSLSSIDENFDPDGNDFDVEGVAKDGGRKSFSVAADGRLLSEEVTLEKAPPAARKTIKEKIGDGKILRIDKSLVEKKDGVLPYEVQGRKDGRPFDFSVGPRGKFLGMDD
jgi:uncharacterized membrane protein YkoI